MSPLLQTHPSCVRRSFTARAPRALALGGLLALLLPVLGCGGITCPEPLSNVDGMCLEVDPVPEVERCDGFDNDGDTEVDEDWPELGEPCGQGAGRGECVEGEWACATDGEGLRCDGAVGPVAEVCDGKDNDCDGTPDNGPREVCDGEDNDCDGLVDEGVLSVKRQVFSDRATVAAIDGGFAVTRVIGERLRVETYDAHGEPSGAFDTIDSPVEQIAFLASDGAGARVLVALGKHNFHVVDIDVDSDLVPRVLETRELHEDWRQGIDFGVYRPPVHPRVVASPARFLGYRDLITFAANPLGADDLLGLAQEPTVAMEIPVLTPFDTAGPFVVWEQGDNLRAGWLLDDGSLLLDIDVGRGEAPGIAIGKGGPGVAYLQDEALHLSELGGGTLLCRDGGFCNDELVFDELEALAGPTALAYDEQSDRWFVATVEHVAVVARGTEGAQVTQVKLLGALSDVPRRVEARVSGGTAAIVHAAPSGDSGLTFLGCF